MPAAEEARLLLLLRAVLGGGAREGELAVAGEGDGAELLEGDDGASWYAISPKWPWLNCAPTSESSNESQSAAAAVRVSCGSVLITAR